MQSDYSQTECYATGTLGKEAKTVVVKSHNTYYLMQGQS